MSKVIFTRQQIVDLQHFGAQMRQNTEESLINFLQDQVFEAAFLGENSVEVPIDDFFEEIIIDVLGEFDAKGFNTGCRPAARNGSYYVYIGWESNEV